MKFITLDLDSGFINYPGIFGLPLGRIAAFIQFERIPLHETVDSGPIQQQTPFGHHFFYISVASECGDSQAAKSFAANRLVNVFSTKLWS